MVPGIWYPVCGSHDMVQVPVIIAVHGEYPADGVCYVVRTGDTNGTWLVTGYIGMPVCWSHVCQYGKGTQVMILRR